MKFVVDPAALIRLAREQITVAPDLSTVHEAVARAELDTNDAQVTLGKQLARAAKSIVDVAAIDALR